MKYYSALLALFLFTLLLLAVYWLHITLYKVDVLLYSSIADGVLATVITATLLFGLSFFRQFNKFEKSLLIVIMLLAGYIFAISIPTVIDRSLSFYILEKIQQRGGGIRFDKFQDVFTKEYVKEHRLVDVRLTEQQASGTIVIENGCVKLTDRGRELATFSRLFRRHFLPKQRLLMGHYSDDLTDPFRNSANITGYECQ